MVYTYIDIQRERFFLFLQLFYWRDNAGGWRSRFHRLPKSAPKLTKNILMWMVMAKPLGHL